MAIALSLFTNVATYNTATKVSPSKTWTSGRLYLLAVGTRFTGGVTVSSIAFTGGSGGTWAKADSLYDGTNLDGEVWWCIATSTVTDTITLTHSAAPSRAQWGVYEITGHDPSPIGVVAHASAGASSTSLSCSLGSFTDATNDATFVSVQHDAQETTTIDTTPAGYVGLDDIQGGATNAMSLRTSWLTGYDATPTNTWTTGARSVIVAVEIKALAAAVPLPHPAIVLRAVPRAVLQVA